MRILINLISGQTIPNLIACKFVNPDKVILLYTVGSIKQKDNFKMTYQNTQYEEYEVDAFNFEDVFFCVKNIIEKNSNNEIILNFTCGTKIMSMASFEIFRRTNLEAIYIDSENAKIYIFKGAQVYNKNLDITLTLEEHLKINGHIYQLDSEKFLDEGRKDYFEYLEKNFNESISKFLSIINAEFEKDRKSFYSNNFSLKQNGNEYYWDDHNQCSSIIFNGNKFVIYGKDSIKYITGLWFEDLVYYKKFLNNNLYDEVRRNIHIQDKKGKQDMIELDIVGLYKNNLHLFELKSGKPRREAINNLKTIKEQLGTYTKVFLISYFDLNDNDPLIERMQDLGIEFYKYSDFTLDKCLKKKNINL